MATFSPCRRELYPDTTTSCAAYLVKAQNDDNGWGGAGGVPSRITLTAKSISALAAFSIQYPETVERGFAFIHVAYRSGELEKKNR